MALKASLEKKVIAQLSQNDEYYLDARATHGAVRRKDRLAPTCEDRLLESAQIKLQKVTLALGLSKS